MSNHNLRKLSRYRKGTSDEGTFEKYFTYYKYNFVNGMFGADEQFENGDFQYEI